MLKLILPVFALFFVMAGCVKDDPDPQDGPFPIEAGEGVFILNEGGFNAGNASVDYFRFADDSLFSGLYQTQNGQPLGDVLQSMAFWGGNAFLVVNNSQKIIGVNPENLNQTSAIGPFVSPRYLLPLPSGKAYLTDLFSNYIHIVDLRSGQKTGDSIQVNGWTEEMLRVGREVFVVNRFTNDILVIDTLTRQLTGKVDVGFDPTSLVQDKNGKLWTLCSGSETLVEKGGLWRIDPASKTVEAFFEFSDFNLGIAPRLRIDGSGEVIYFLKNDIYKMSINDLSLPAAPLVANGGRNLYSLDIHPLTGEVFTSDALDFSQQGTIYRYTSDGEEIRSFKAGVNPNGFVFY